MGSPNGAERGKIPVHVAVIMDGNGRWAKKRLMPRSAGHRAGMKRMLRLAEHAFASGVKVLTLYALSAENFNRPREELQGLFSLFREYFSQNADKLAKKGIELRVIGDLDLLPADVARLIEDGVLRTSGGKAGTLVFAIGYGARQEILRAVNRAVTGGKPLTEGEFSALLDTAGLPDPDLLIRTGKECRLSNFLLFQCAYTELYFSDKLFPDFSERDFESALNAYKSRERRFGRTE